MLKYYIMLVNRRENGFGIQYGARFDECTIPYEPWFDDRQQYLDRASNNGAVVLGGEPGAGKSHITADVFREAYDQGMYVCMISCHINAGGQAGRAQTHEILETAEDVGSECLVVIDNLDFMVYTGGLKRRRTNARVGEYATFLTEKVYAIEEAGCAVFATVHSDEWRNNHSQAPEDIRSTYDQLVAQLGGEIEFTGEISLQNAERLLRNRGIPAELTSAIAQDLLHEGKLCFRQAHHLSLETYIAEGISAACEEVDTLKAHKIQGGA